MKSKNSKYPWDKPTNNPTVNSDLYQKTVNDKDERQKLLDHLIELNTIRWTKEHFPKGIRVNQRYMWNTKHPYIKYFLKHKLIRLIRERWRLSNSYKTIMTYKEIIVMAKYITEVLKELNSNPKLFETEYKKFGNGGPLGIVFKHAFTNSNKFDLPPGTPPFKESTEPMGMTPGSFIVETKKFHYFCNSSISATKREMLFVQLCEAIHPEEAKILVAIKDQKLHELYPNITPGVVAKAGFIDAVDMIEPVLTKPTQTKRGSKPKNSQTPGESGILQGEDQILNEV